MSLGLFEGFGIELEYMIVDDDSLDVRGLADAVLRAASGNDDAEVEMGDLAWSNELVLHVIELKTNGPSPSLAGLADIFHRGVRQINGILRDHSARLMPTAMHPWMNPDTETRLWPHENSTVYSTFDRIFDCSGHGWANLQSIHINLPFKDNGEFGRLHAAIRLVLPILPALAASSPIVGGLTTGLMDNRLEFYRHNCHRVPSITGHVIPERVFSQEEYEERLLELMYRDIAPLDPKGILAHEWLNARGAIARFDRNTIEIRLLDVQESPSADLAVCTAVVAVIRALVEERSVDYETQKTWTEHELEAILLSAIRGGDRTVFGNTRYLRQLGYSGSVTPTGQELWRHLIHTCVTGPDAGGASGQALENLAEHGCLSRRVLDSVGSTPKRTALHAAYESLCDCLDQNRMFDAIAP